MASRPIALPPRFKCLVGGEWKATSEFSQKQLNKWTRKKRHDNDGVTSINIGLVCKAHSGAPLNPTMRCQGPCNQLKVREAFSKNQRNRPDAWCKRCTEWKERQEPFVPPTAPPGGDLSLGETYLDTARMADSSDNWDLDDIEADEEDDHDDDEDHDHDHDLHHGLHHNHNNGNNHNSHSFSDVGGDEDADPSLLKSVTRSIFRRDDRDDYDVDDSDDDDVVKYEVGNSIIGQLPRPPSVGSVASTKASVGGTQASSIAEGPRPTRPSYARSTDLGSTSTAQALRQTVPASMASSVTSGDNRSVKRPPPHLGGHVFGQSTVAPNTQTTASIHRRPQLRGMSVQDPGLMTGPQQSMPSTMPSTDSRADVESLAPSTVVSARPNTAQYSEVQGYNAYNPRGNMRPQTTSEYPKNAGKGIKEVKVGPSGWLKLDNRKRFDVPPLFAANAEDFSYAEPAYESGEDEM